MRNNYGVTSDARWVSTSAAPQLVGWGSVFSGTIIAIGVFILLSALWLALSFANHDSVVYDNLSWWIAGTAIFCMFLAGLIASLTSAARGAGAGSLNALTTWGLVAIAVAVVIVPTFSIGNVPNFVTVSGHVYRINYLSYWTVFWSAIIGLGASLLGGLIGGSLPRRPEGPYLDLQRATVVGTPVVAQRAGVVEQPATMAPPYGVGQPSGVGQTAPVGAQSPADVAPADTMEPTRPVGPDRP